MKIKPFFLTLALSVSVFSCKEEPPVPASDLQAGGDPKSLKTMAVLGNEVDFETGAYNQGCNPIAEACGDKDPGCDCGLNVSMKVVNKNNGHPARSGNHSSYHRLANCHERAEFVSQCSSTMGYNEEVWAGWSVFIPSGTAFRIDNTSTIITQFHDRWGSPPDNEKPPRCAGESGSPTSITLKEDGKLYLKIRYEDQIQNCMNTKEFVIGSYAQMAGKWTDFVVKARFTNDASRGFFRIWAYEAGTTPVLKKDYRGSTYWKKNDGTTNGGPAFRMGMYRGDPGKVPGDPVVLYTDEYRSGKASTGVDFNDVAPPAPVSVNKALNKPVTFSGQQIGNEASDALDDNLNTKWSAQNYPQYIQVDLGATTSINKTELAPNFSRAYKYKVEVKTTSSGTYTTVVNKTNNTTGGALLTDTFASINARYVKLTITGCSGSACSTSNWASIHEFRVF